ncbi:MAG: type III pantothenate kinase [Deltaproteobacteria bacterium]|nr:type III pantothenate kinase [Deltaproteobacteria bacterium]
MSTGTDRDLLILVDVGNTNAVFGVLKENELIYHFRLSTTARRTADEYVALLLPLLQRAGLDPGRVEAVVISSVVPPLHFALEQMSRQVFGCEPMFIDAHTDTGLPLRYDHPAEVGADRIVNALAARELHGSPVVVVDFGTATTFDVVNGEGEYVGGLITPGISISSEALFAKASRLYRVEIVQPKSLIGSNTEGAMQAGIFYGFLGQVDGILARLKLEMPGLETVIATGGLAELIASASNHIDHVDQMLTLTGLRLIYQRSRHGLQE